MAQGDYFVKEKFQRDKFKGAIDATKKQGELEEFLDCYDDSSSRLQAASERTTA